MTYTNTFAQRKVPSSCLAVITIVPALAALATDSNNQSDLASWNGNVFSLAERCKGTAQPLSAGHLFATPCRSTPSSPSRPRE